MAEREETLRAQMVGDQIAGRGIRDEAVLRAMQSVPRHLFVPSRFRDRAYDDSPLPIDKGQTISQPYIVAYMCERLHLDKSSRVLEIGTGSGYQAAVLSEISGSVVTIEIVELLYRRARRLLSALGYANVDCRLADGTTGAPEDAPFDGIVAAASARRVPESLLRQLSDGGSLIYPEGSPHGYQELVLITRNGRRFDRRELIGVRFVPMTGLAGKL